MDVQQLYRLKNEKRINVGAKGYNKRSSEHLNLYGKNDFDLEIHRNYLSHEDINNLKVLEVELIFKWNVGDLLIFDRSKFTLFLEKNINQKKLGNQFTRLN